MGELLSVLLRFSVSVRHYKLLFQHCLLTGWNIPPKYQ